MTSLEEVAQISGGGTPSRAVPQYFGGGICWATPTDVTALEGLYIQRTKETLTEEGLNRSSAKLLPPGAVLLTSRATIGYTAVTRVPICTNQGFVNFVCGPTLEPEYLAYWLRARKPLLERLANGATFKEISRGTVRKLAINLPDRGEQLRIVELLSRAENIVRMRREAETRTKEIIPALFLDMFGDPASNPKGWEVRRLGEIVDRFQGGKNVQAGASGDSEFRILKISAVTSGKYDESESKPAPGGFSPPPHYFVRQGDILFSRANTEELVGATAMVVSTDGRSLLPDKLWRLVWRPDARVRPPYMLALLQNLSTRKALSNIASGTGGSMKNISQAKLSKLRLPIAPMDTQIVFERNAASANSLFGGTQRAGAVADQAFQSLLAGVFGEEQ